MTTAGMLTAPRTGAHPIEHFARRHHRALARWLTRNYGRRLTEEDISDVLSETYKAALETDETSGFDRERMSAWAYHVARFRAIAVIRERHGRSSREHGEPDRPARAVVLSLDSIMAGDGAAAFAARPEEVRRVTEALRKLPHDQREALQHVHIDGLTIRAAAELLGTSKSTFDRLHQRAIQRLKELCSAAQSADCGHARALLGSKSALAPELLGWRDAHVEGCFACQVAAGRRVHLTLPALPVVGVAVPGALTRALDRVGSLLTGNGDLPGEAVAAGVTTAARGGTLGASVLGGAGAKAAACALACTAVAAVPVVTAHRHPGRPATGHHETAKDVRALWPTPASERATTAQEHVARKGANAAAADRRRARLAAKRRRAKARAESDADHAAAAPSARHPAIGSSSPLAAPARRIASASTASSTSSPRSGSSFAQEFLP
jgi:RNA polymerase sigma factor (sigma-70 family)